MANKIRCKLDGRQSVTIPIALKKNGRFLTRPVNIVVRGFVKFNNEPNIYNDIYEDVEYQKQSAHLLENRTIVYPVLFSSNEITVYNGRGAITLLPRSEDILIDFNTLSGRLEQSVTVNENEVLLQESDAQIIIETGKERVPYQISIEVTIIDNQGEYFGQTIDRGIDDTNAVGGGLFQQFKKEMNSNLIVEFYNDEEWLPAIQRITKDNMTDTVDEVLNLVDNMSKEISFGSSAMYDALSASATFLSNNDFDELRKVIYLLTDNDSNMSIATPDETILNINTIDGDKKVPVISGNLQIVEPVTLSVKANTTDTVALNKIGFLTGGQSITIINENSIDDLVNIFYGEAAGSMGYGYYEFIYDMQEKVLLQSVKGNFSIYNNNSNINWQIETSEDGYSYTSYSDVFSENDIFSKDNLLARYIKIKIKFVMGFTGDEYDSIIQTPILNNFTIVYNKEKIVYLFLNKEVTNISPYQMVISVDGQVLNSEQIEVGLATSDSYNWIDFYNGSRQTVFQNGKIVEPLRFSQDITQFVQEPLIKVDDYTLKTTYGSWDIDSNVVIYDENNNVISSTNYKLVPRKGKIIFNYMLPYNYVEGNYSIGILNKNEYKIGLKLKNISNVENLEIYGIGQMYTTGKNLLPPVEKRPPEITSLIISPATLNLYSVVSLDYVYFDSNYDVEDISKREVRWFINGVHIEYLDNLIKWNDISDINDPLYQNVLSFNLADLGDQDAEQRARSLKESILQVGDVVYCTLKVSDGDMSSEIFKSESLIVEESAPTVTNISIKSINSSGAILNTVSSNNIAFVSFDIVGDVEGNSSEIIWYVNGNEFKRGIYGAQVSSDQTPNDKIYPGEISLNTGDWALRLGYEIYVQIIPNTGSSRGDAVSSGSVLVQNAIPEIANAIILPTAVTQYSDMTLTWDFIDFDINVLKDATQSEQTVIKWFVKDPPINSSQSTTFKEVTNTAILNYITTDIVNHTSIVSSQILSNGQEWYAELTPNDGLDDGKVVKTITKKIGIIS